MRPTRREFLKQCGAVSLGFAGLNSLLLHTANAIPDVSSRPVSGLGPLLRDPHGLLDLPEGFSYKVFSLTGQVMNDGFEVPMQPDGMGAFPGPDGKTILIRNHEVSSDVPSGGPFGRGNQRFEDIDLSKVYDAGFGKNPGLGGTTTVLFNTKTQTKEFEYLSLAGTVRNCAGGPTPWNSWITCEETVDRAGDRWEKDHGYNFEVPADHEITLADPVPLVAMGRFNHEAVAVDPRSGVVYQTEDRADGVFYRYIPSKPGELAAGGRLQALVVADQPGLDARNWTYSRTVPIRQRLAVKWIDLSAVESPEDDLRYRAYERGAARFARGEGAWTGADGVYFACTSGGRAECGQIWRYVPSASEGTPQEEAEPGTLELFVEPNDSGLIDNADNLTIAPWGDLVVCEDGDGEQYVVGITPEGGIYQIARNATGGSEFAGACFSPDGSTLFVNIQKMGLSLAITGAWDSRLA
jgi:secreted PhoX family phosphatase